MKKINIYALTLVLLAIGFALMFFWRRDPVVVSLDGGVIHRSAYDRICKSMLAKRKNRAEGSLITPSEQQQILQILIRDKILRITAQRAGIPTDMGDLDIGSRENFLPTNQIRSRLEATEWAVSDDEVKQYLNSGKSKVPSGTPVPTPSDNEPFQSAKKYLQHQKALRWFEKQESMAHVQINEAVLQTSARSK